MKFDGKLVLITGAATGIGRATARSLGQLGARVVIVDINEDGAKEAAKSVPGGKAVAFRCNLANDQEVADLQRQVESSCGVVDILINNAAKPPVTGSILNVGLDQFQAAFDVNVLGYLRTIKAFCRECWSATRATSSTPRLHWRCFLIHRSASWAPISPQRVPSFP